jgi:hypothetical protein
MSCAEAWGVRPDGSNPCRLVKRYTENKRELAEKFTATWTEASGG